MRQIKTMRVALALLICVGTVLAITATGADERSDSKNRFRVTVVDVVGGEESVVKQIRIDTIPNCYARITSGQEGGGGIAAAAGSAEDRQNQATITVAVLADHVTWTAGNVNAVKFLMSIDGRGKAEVSDTGPMVVGKQLNDIFAVTLKSGDYEYGTEIPILRFRDRTFSLTVAAPASGP